MFKRYVLCGGMLLLSCNVWAADSELLDVYQADKQVLADFADLESIPNSVIVKFKPAASQANIKNALAAAKASTVRGFELVPGLQHIRTNLPVDKAIAALKRNPHVEYAELDFVQKPLVTANDTYLSLQWGLQNSGQTINGVTGLANADINMPEAWDFSTGGDGCVVAVLDTGTQWSHPDLDGNIWSNPAEIAGNLIDDDKNGLIDDVRGWDFYAKDNNPDDENGHGTHTAGTIAARSNNQRGVAGIAWNCKIMPLRFLGPNGGSTTDAIAALNYAVSKGVKVSNNSWGGGGYSAGLFDAIKNAQTIGHIFVAAAGNSGLNSDTSPGYPAAYNLDNIVSVAASDNRDSLASFSNFGPSSVDLAAPGVDIASTYMGSGYVYSSGTSMAAPHVAGVTALLYLRNPAASYAQIIDKLLSSTRSVTGLIGYVKTGYLWG